MAKLRGIVIGCGGRSGGHHQGLREAAGTELAAVVDLDRERADRMAEANGVPAYYDVTEALDKEKPEIVTICTREHPRHALTMTTLEHDCVRAIVEEKPIARSLAEAQAMVAAAEDKGVQLTVSHQMRFCDEFIEGRQAVLNGDVGEPYFMRTVCFGALMEQGPHMIDMALWFAGDAKPVWALGAVDEIERSHEMVHPCPSWTVGYVAFDNGMRYVIESGRFKAPLDPQFPDTWLQKRIQVLGREGLVDAMVGHYVKILSPRGLSEKQVGLDPWNRATIALYEEVVQVLDKGGEHRNDAKYALDGMQIMTALYQSVLDRASVAIPVADPARTPLEEILELAE